MSTDPIIGYRPQDEAAIGMVNDNKRLEERVLRVFDALDELAGMGHVDVRWLRIARTHIEQGFMALNRSLMRPVRVDPDSAKPQEGEQYDAKQKSKDGEDDGRGGA